MRHFIAHPVATMAREPRGGLTLAEVLVSMLIMSIGIILLATLIPVSVARTAQASQLTQAVFLRNNAEAFIEYGPNILSNNVIPLNTTTSPYNTLAVLDPMGVAVYGTGVSFAGTATRAPVTAINLATAQQYSMLPDSWTDVFDSAITAYNGTGITTSTAASTINPWNSTNTSNAHYRMVLFDSTNKLVVLRDLLSVSGSTISWQDGTINESALPSGFVPARVRVETQVQRFTWIMTVNKYWTPTAPNSLAWEAELNVAVFFNRSFNRNSDETLYTISQPVDTNGNLIGYDGAYGVAGYDDNSNGQIDTDAAESGWLGSDDNRTVIVAFTAGSPPPLKKGGFMLDPNKLRWYRIINMTQILPTSTQATLLLDRDLRLPITTGVFMKGIVDVYPLGIRTGQQ